MEAQHVCMPSTVLNYMLVERLSLLDSNSFSTPRNDVSLSISISSQCYRVYRRLGFKPGSQDCSLFGAHLARQLRIV